MAQPSLNRRLSTQDASFLYFEREEAPLHIGSIAVLEGDLSYERLLEAISNKLHLIPRYLQRAVPGPFNIAHPSWEWDPDFDIKRHIKEVTIEGPGNDRQLTALAANLFAPMLDRQKPLWEMYLVHGLEHGRSAIVSKVHHCLVDGVSGIELLMIVFDVSPNPIPVEPPAREPPPPIPGPAALLTDAVWDNLADGIARAAELQRTLVESALEGDNRRRRMLRAWETVAPYLRQPVDRAPFNKPLRGNRTLAVSEFSFAEIRAIRAACGGTVNDVVLAVLGGALGRYLELHGQKTQE